MAPSPGKVRLDILLLERGLAESRARAQAYIAAGHVFHKTERLLKCGQMVPADLELRIELPHQDVSRGAAKLRGALEHFRFSAHGRVAADLGASTGGFTQVLLEQGAMRVHAVDVGYGLLHERLRRDSRVILHEKTNARFLTEYDLEPIDIAVMDLSFIGLELILPAVSRITHFSSDCVALIKPQFEAGRGQVGKGGVVRDPETIQRVLLEHRQHLGKNGFSCLDIVPSEIKGRKGNQEYLSWFKKISPAPSLEKGEV